MLSIPPALQAQFEECLRNKAIPKKRMGLIRNGCGGRETLVRGFPPREASD